MMGAICYHNVTIRSKERYKGERKADNEDTKLLFCLTFENTPLSADEFAAVLTERVEISAATWTNQKSVVL